MKAPILLLTLSALSSHAMAFELQDPKANDTEKLVWTGHLSPDTDTVTSAIAAAYIYGGTAVVPEAINPESQFVLEYCKAETPKQLESFASKQVGLVDFNQTTQLHPTIEQSSIVAIIDHHAIGGSPVNMSQIAAIDIRAWGSAATILADRAQSLQINFPKDIACTTLGGILSDTVVFTSSTTTPYDLKYAEQLAELAGIEDIEAFGQQMLVAKSDLSHLPAETILTMDYKHFNYGGKTVGIGVAETITAQQLLDREDEFVVAMQQYKKANNLDHLFFSVTDTKNQRANILTIDQIDAQLAQESFKAETESSWLVLDGVTSRKRQIGPAIQSTLEANAL